MKTKKLTVAQAILAYLEKQYTARDGKEQAFFAGCAGIFGHGNLAGFGQALHQNPDFPYIMVRNEQAAVHMAAGYAKPRHVFPWYSRHSERHTSNFLKDRLHRELS